MKAASTLQAPALARPQRVKKLLTRGIIYLTSEKFSIFVTAIAALICWAGVCIDDDHVIGYVGIVFLAGFTPWAIRQTLREMRQDKLGLKEW